MNSNIISIHQKKIFSISEARELLPIVRRITRVAHHEVKMLTAQMGAVSSRTRKQELEEEIQNRFTRWQSKVQRLGADPKGMWLVDFDSGKGFYCWHYPESDISHFHGYFEGFKGRVKIH